MGVDPAAIVLPRWQHGTGISKRQPTPGAALSADHVNCATALHMRIKRNPAPVRRPVRRSCWAVLGSELQQVVSVAIADPQVLAAGSARRKNDFLAVGRKLRAMIFGREDQHWPQRPELPRRGMTREPWPFGAPNVAVP